MNQETNSEAEAHYKCVGIGVGPANLSLASLLCGRPELPNLFLERRDAFGWHDGQQIPGASLQVSMIKDLVSLSDPTNAFSFLAYLHERGRIYHFLNARFDAVPRQEFRNYLEWASLRNPNLVFGEEVVSVDFDGDFVVRTPRRTVTAENISLGVGVQPWVPDCARVALGETQFHISEFMHRAGGLGGKRVCVVGGGQSGAEAFLDLISRTGAQLPRRVSWVSRRANYFPIDDSPFTNDYYMPGYSDHFYNLDPATRERFIEQHVLTSDGISESTLRAIYQRAYLLKFVERNEDVVALYPAREVVRVTAGAGWDLALAPVERGRAEVSEHVEADVVVWATGFRPAATDFLAPIADRLERDGDEYRIDGDFAACWDGPPDRNIFVQNGARRQRGLADPNLSLIAWRSQRIVDRLCGTRGDDQLPSFIEWSAKQPSHALRDGC